VKLSAIAAPACRRAAAQAPSRRDSPEEGTGLRRAFVAALAALAAGLCGPAGADDSQPPALPTPGISWSGFHIGVNYGASWGSARWTDEPGDTVLFQNSPAGSAIDGLLGGAQIGYDYQAGPWVVGIEGMLDAADLRGDANCGGVVGVGGEGWICSTQTTALGSLTGRLGYAVGEVLVYGRGGLAYAHDDYGFETGVPPFDDVSGDASEDRFGWTLGAGLEIALDRHWSVRGEYDYYGFGSDDVEMTDPATGAVADATIDRSQQIVTVGLNYRFGGDASQSAVPAPAIADDIEAEFGTRVGWSTGEFRKDLYDPFVHSQENSRLTYSDLDAVGVEAFARIEHDSGVFLKGYIGGADVYGGSLLDEDFPPALFRYSATDSDQEDGRDIYGAADIGFDLVNRPQGKLGLFTGYFYYSQRENAMGCVQVGSNPLVCGIDPVDDDVQVITEREEWQAWRLGVAAELMLTNRVKLAAEAAWLPYASYDGSDSHWLRPDINELPEEGTGHGDGVQLEGVLSYLVNDRLSVGVGGRYWLIEADGETQFPGDLPSSPETFRTERSGVFVQMAYKLGGDPAKGIFAGE
jgi:opacity protein-like surface antigen